MTSKGNPLDIMRFSESRFNVNKEYLCTILQKTIDVMLNCSCRLLYFSHVMILTIGRGCGGCADRLSRPLAPAHQSMYTVSIGFAKLVQDECIFLVLVMFCEPLPRVLLIWWTSFIVTRLQMADLLLEVCFMSVAVSPRCFKKRHLRQEIPVVVFVSEMFLIHESQRLVFFS